MSAPASGRLHKPQRVFTAGFTTWLGASTLAAVGDGVVYFAIGWTAAGAGGSVAGLVMTLVVLPRTLLLLVGGAAGDRWGLRRTVIGCDAFMCVVLVVYLLVGRTSAPTVWMLAVLAFTLGVASAFRMPAAGAFPRLFADGDGLARAMSVTSSLLQVARLIGPPLGGTVVAVLGMAGAVSANLVGFVLILLVLLLVRPPYEQPATGSDGSTVDDIREGLRAARRLPGVPSLLGAVALVAAGVIPMLSLCVPLAAHERGWSAGTTGLIEAVWVVGTLSITLAVARFGTRRRAIGPLTAGPLVTAAGVVMIAVSGHPVGAVLGSLVLGVGTATFTTHVLPLYVLQTPDGMLARFQSLLGVVQAAPMLATNNVLGGIAAAGHVALSMGVVAALAVLASVLIVTSRAVRGARIQDQSR